MTRRPFFVLTVLIFAANSVPPPAWAGMPTDVLSEWAALRLETVSFFLIVFFLAAAGVRWLWNWLAADFPALPRLSYAETLAGLLVVGLASEMQDVGLGPKAEGTMSSQPPNDSFDAMIRVAAEDDRQRFGNWKQSNAKAIDRARRTRRALRATLVVLILLAFGGLLGGGFAESFVLGAIGFLSGLAMMVVASRFCSLGFRF